MKLLMPATIGSTLKTIPRPVILFILLGVFVVGYFFLKQGVKTVQKESVLSKQEGAALVEDVGKLMVLPTGETPTIATISDKNSLQHETFFEGAQNGDKVLVYTKARTVILYRPTSKKIVNVAQLDTGTTATGKRGTTPFGKIVSDK